MQHGGGGEMVGPADAPVEAVVAADAAEPGVHQPAPHRHAPARDLFGWIVRDQHAAVEQARRQRGGFDGRAEEDAEPRRRPAGAGRGGVRPSRPDERRGRRRGRG